MRWASFLWLLLPLSASAQQKLAVVSQASHIRQAPDGTSTSQCQVAVGDTLVVMDDGASTNGYYHVQASRSCQGYVYRNRVRLHMGTAPKWAHTPVELPTPVEKRLKVCSFNIKWLGHYSRKDNDALAQFLSKFDVVVIQELVAPPISVIGPGTNEQADAESAAFFEAMRKKGFAYQLGTSGTGKTSNGPTSREWPVAFYRTDAVSANYQKSGFVATPTIGHTTFDRVPWGFHFTTIDSTLDFVLTTVHLAAEASDKPQRKAELAAISAWTSTWTNEFDHIILGDMNLQDTNEVKAALPAGFVTLNAKGLNTNLSTKSPKPFDQVLYRPQFTGTDLGLDVGFQVTDLVATMRPSWTNPNEAYPGEPFNSTLFPQYYSDHNPVSFELKYGLRDDD